MKRAFCLALVLTIAWVGTAAERRKCAIAQTNEHFTVSWNVVNGALALLIFNGDADRMNWIHGLESWGEIRTNVRRINGKDAWSGAGFRDSEKLPFKGMRMDGGKIVSFYDNGILRADVVVNKLVMH